MSPRPNLQVIPGFGEAVREPYVLFCGHCAKRPEPADEGSRVCSSCHLGLIVSAPESLAQHLDRPCGGVQVERGDA